MVGRKPHRGANYSNPVRFPKPYSAVPIRVALVSCVVEFMKRLPHTVCVAVSPSLPPRLPPTDSHFRAKPTRNRPTTDGRFSSPLVSFPSLPSSPRSLPPRPPAQGTRLTCATIAFHRWWNRGHRSTIYIPRS